MSEPRSLDERLLEKETQLKKLLEKADQYKAQLKQLQNRKADEDRKVRTHKLIVCGAKIASVFGRPLEEDESKRLAAFLREQKTNGTFVLRSNEEIQPTPQNAGYESAEDSEEPTNRTFMDIFSNF